MFLHDIPHYNEAPPCYVWLQKVEQLTRYLLDKPRQHIHTDMVTALDIFQASVT